MGLYLGSSVRALTCQRRQMRSGMSKSWQSLTVRHARFHADYLEVFEAPSRPSVDLFHALTSKVCLARRLGQRGALGL